MSNYLVVCTKHNVRILRCSFFGFFIIAFIRVIKVAVYGFISSRRRGLRLRLRLRKRRARERKFLWQHRRLLNEGGTRYLAPQGCGWLQCSRSRIEPERWPERKVTVESRPVTRAGGFSETHSAQGNFVAASIKEVSQKRDQHRYITSTDASSWRKWCEGT